MSLRPGLKKVVHSNQSAHCAGGLTSVLGLFRLCAEGAASPGGTATIAASVLSLRPSQFTGAHAGPRSQRGDSVTFVCVLSLSRGQRTRYDATSRLEYSLIGATGRFPLKPQ